MEKKVVYDDEKIAISFIAPHALSLDFILASFNNDGILAETTATSKEITAGENTVYIPYSALAQKLNTKLMVWDKALSPVINSTQIN